MVLLNSISVTLSPDTQELIKNVAIATGSNALALIVTVVDGSPLPFKSLFSGLVKLIQDQVDASDKSEIYAQEARRRVDAAYFQVFHLPN